MRSGNVVSNSGTIQAVDFGILGEDNNTVTNSGTIRADDVDGIHVHDNSVVTNSGLIVADEDGIEVFDDSTVTNSGSIISGDDGIDVGGINTIINTGTIVSVFDDGIDSEGVGNTVINTGTIFGFEAGIDQDTSGNTIINSGTIGSSQGPTGLAFDFGNTFGFGPDRLVFLNSPLTIGGILFADGGADDTVEFQVAGGRSLDVTFTPLPLTLIHDESLQSTVVDRPNNRVIYVDPTGFSANSVWLDSLARSIFDAVDGANDGSAPTSSSNSFFLQTGDASGNDEARPYRVWALGFASASRLMASGVNGELTTLSGGTVFGMDANISVQNRMGLFGGVAGGRMNVENDHQSIDTTAGYLGAYSQWTNDDYFGSFTIFGGFAEQDSERDVANNLVVGGLEKASASYSSFFVSPALTIGKQLTELPDGRPLLGSLRVHYSGMWMDGYTETGVTNPVTVDDRAIHRLGARAQVSFPEDIQAANGAMVHVERRFGVDYAFSADSQDVSATVVGLPLNFEADYGDQGPAGFIGADFTMVLEGGDRAIKAGSEVRLTTDGSVELRSQITYKSTF